MTEPASDPVCGMSIDPESEPGRRFRKENPYAANACV